ncbi:MAG: hypothetical protein WBO38_04010 [Chitinophagaceae bacterium]
MRTNLFTNQCHISAMLNMTLIGAFETASFFYFIKQLHLHIRFIPNNLSMAFPSIGLINALRETATRLRNGAHYAWGHHGACNCGNLLQVLTPLSEKEILSYAHTGAGEWTELAEEYCSSSNAPVNLVLSKLEQAGLTPTDIHHIEFLTDKAVLNFLPGGFRWLKRNVREDVILYFEAFANLLEEKLIQSVDIRIEDIMATSLIGEKQVALESAV